MKAEWAFSNDGINMTKMLPQKKLGEKPLKSLKISCLDNICKNITYWMGYLPENANKYLYVITPFDVLCKCIMCLCIKSNILFLYIHVTNNNFNLQYSEEGGGLLNYTFLSN